MNRGVIIGLLLAVTLGLALRLPGLAARPMHNDEAVNAIKLRGLMEQGTFIYDPHEYHGPALFYFSLAWTKLLGVSDFTKLTESQLRGLTVAFGVGLILLLALVADGLGKRAAICAGIFTAISPAMVFYSRDFIHEMLLVFFTFLAIAAGWRWFRSQKTGWAVLAGAAVGLMHATKETFVLALAAVIAAIFFNGKWSREHDDRRLRRPGCGRPLAAALIAAVLVSVIFYSSFFTNLGGVLDSVKTFLPMLHRAGGGSAHVHPWNFYFARLLFFQGRHGRIWSEGFIFLLALTGIFSGLSRRGAAGSDADFVRFLSIYTILLAAIYSVIAYKTPWCLLGFWHGAILLAGVGVNALSNFARGRWTAVALGIVLLAGGVHLGFEARRACMTFSGVGANPYAYANTSEDVFELVSRVNKVALAGPDGRRARVDVIVPGDDYWPLPWYLRDFANVGWRSAPPEKPAPIEIIAAKTDGNVALGTDFVDAGLFELRPDNFVELRVDAEWWRRQAELKNPAR